MPTTNTTLVSPHALIARLGQDTPVRVLDVRTPAEFDTAHIPGSYNVPLDTLQEHREELTSHLTEPVILICRSGQRATQASTALTDVGLTGLQVLDGGIVAWEAAGGALTRGQPRWELERQVRLVAGLIVLVSVVTSAVAPGAQWVAGMVGAGLTFAALSNTCAMGMLLARLPYNRGPRRDPRQIIADLASPGTPR